MPFVLKPKQKSLNQNKEKVSLIIFPWGRVSLAMSWLSVSFKLKTIAKSKNTLRVEIKQFCDGNRNTMRSSYALDKI